jgi:hypothetical protein
MSLAVHCDESAGWWRRCAIARSSRWVRSTPPIAELLLRLNDPALPQVRRHAGSLFEGLDVTALQPLPIERYQSASCVKAS